MSDSKSDASGITPFDIDGMRLRPEMYIGGTDFFGFVQYLVSAFDLMLGYGATWIEFESGNTIRISSNARLDARLDEQGAMVPFEAFDPSRSNLMNCFDGVILFALSAHFRAVITDGQQQTQHIASCGRRESLTQSATDAEPGVLLELQPDSTIFSVTRISPAVVRSYCRRTARFHPGIAFRIRSGDDVTEFKSTQGIRDFFDAVSLPYQLLHEPIHVREDDGELFVETVFVLQSSSENQIWSFANKERVPDGGTHEDGLMEAVARIRNHKSMHLVGVQGVLAVLAIEYPTIAYEGCVKRRVGNPELRDRVRDLVVRGIERWTRENPDEAQRLNDINRFRFPHVR